MILTLSLKYILHISHIEDAIIVENNKHDQSFQDIKQSHKRYKTHYQSDRGRIRCGRLYLPWRT